MKQRAIIALTLLLYLFSGNGCSDPDAAWRSCLADPDATPMTVALYRNLHMIAESNILFGQQDALEYGHGWRGPQVDRSDVKSVTGTHPAVIGADFIGVESANLAHAKAVQRDVVRIIRDTYRRGGVTTLCWHQGNPAGGSFYWAQDSLAGVRDILPGGNYHGNYCRALRRIAEIAHAACTDEGESVPVIFRPYHEFDGEWFWWGAEHCTPEEFVSLWRFTVEYLRDTLGVHNFLYAFSPDCKFTTPEMYLERYPGDAYVDLLGMDDYWDFRPDGANDPTLVARKLAIVTSLARERRKLAALTETGLESVSDPQWYSSELLPILRQTPGLCYVLVWRNAWDLPHHYYTPYEGHPAEADFRAFCNDGYILLERDMPAMYQ